MHTLPYTDRHSYEDAIHILFEVNAREYFHYVSSTEYILMLLLEKFLSIFPSL